MKHVDIYLAADTSFYDTHPRDRIVAHTLEINSIQKSGISEAKGSYGNEAALKGLLVALNRLTKDVEVMVHVDSTYLESQINTGNIYLWMDRKGLKSDMTPIRYKDLWMETLAAVQRRCLNRIKSSRVISSEKQKQLKDCISRYVDERNADKNR